MATTGPAGSLLLFISYSGSITGEISYEKVGLKLRSLSEILTETLLALRCVVMAQTLAVGIVKLNFNQSESTVSGQKRKSF